MGGKEKVAAHFLFPSPLQTFGSVKGGCLFYFFFSSPPPAPRFFFSLLSAELFILSVVKPGLLACIRHAVCLFANILHSRLVNYQTSLTRFSFFPSSPLSLRLSPLAPSLAPSPLFSPPFCLLCSLPFAAVPATPRSQPPIVAGGAGAGAGRGRLPGLPGRADAPPRPEPPARLPGDCGAARGTPSAASIGGSRAAVPPCQGPALALGSASLTAELLQHARGLSPWIQRGALISSSHWSPWIQHGEPSSPAASWSRPLGKGSLVCDSEIHQCLFHSWSCAASFILTHHLFPAHRQLLSLKLFTDCECSWEHSPPPHF
ncbi:uncharacterized protein GJ701_003835 isoform 1-T1 [Geothlypis trichas]